MLGCFEVLRDGLAVTDRAWTTQKAKMLLKLLVLHRPAGLHQEQAIEALWPKQSPARGNASFLIISPQSDPTQGEHPEAERRLRRALADLRGEGIDAHGQVAHPDPFSAALDAIGEERVDEIIVSTFAPSRSPWLRKNLVQRLHDETKLPVEHIVFQPDQVEEGTPA